ncbi:hypothetical protein G7046_g7249 [Stylonectria norvegica]|nr:hypothetical protein G7046_g7249 [Stylonectria norvegica]
MALPILLALLTSLTFALPRAPPMTPPAPSPPRIPGIDSHKLEPYNPADPTFGNNCHNVSLTGADTIGALSIQGHCVDGQANEFLTALNLNHCAVNVMGALEYFDNPHGFDDSCSKCELFTTDSIEGLIFVCECLAGDDDLEFGYLQFGNDVEDPLAVKAYNGTFICGGHLGTKVPL